MNCKFIGTGGALDYQFGNASMIIDLPTRVLVDCGPSIYPKLMEKNLLETFDYLLLTHLHGDHVGSIFQVQALYRVLKPLKPLTNTPLARLVLLIFLDLKKKWSITLAI